MGTLPPAIGSYTEFLYVEYMDKGHALQLLMRLPVARMTASGTLEELARLIVQPYEYLESPGSGLKRKLPSR